jgi:surface antigen
MTRSGVLRNAFDILEKKSGACPSNSSARGEGIDHIYIASKEASVSKWLRIKNADTEYASDHFPVYTDVSIGGSGKVGTSVMGDDYRVECRNYGPSVTCSNQCVDFVKFRLKKHIDRNKFNDFTSGTGGIAAYTSSVNLGRLYGYKVDKVPAVHAVVSWPAGGVPGNSANSTYGHVAMVAQVNSDGSIVVEEYNYIAEKYGVRRIPADAARQLTYAHTEVDYK